jgi:hypothetical protein
MACTKIQNLVWTSSGRPPSSFSTLFLMVTLNAIGLKLPLMVIPVNLLMAGLSYGLFESIAVKEKEVVAILTPPLPAMGLRPPNQPPWVEDPKFQSCESWWSTAWPRTTAPGVQKAAVEPRDSLAPEPCAHRLESVQAALT